MSTIKLSKLEASNLIDKEEYVQTSSWRWGTVESYVFERDGKHYRADIRFHSEEGPQIDYGIEAYEVEPIDRVVTHWVRVKDEANHEKKET